MWCGDLTSVTGCTLCSSSPPQSIGVSRMFMLFLLFFCFLFEMTICSISVVKRCFNLKRWQKCKPIGWNCFSFSTDFAWLVLTQSTVPNVRVPIHFAFSWSLFLFPPLVLNNRFRINDSFSHWICCAFKIVASPESPYASNSLLSFFLISLVHFGKRFFDFFFLLTTGHWPLLLCHIPNPVSGNFTLVHACIFLSFFSFSFSLPLFTFSSFNQSQNSHYMWSTISQNS